MGLFSKRTAQQNAFVGTAQDLEKIGRSAFGGDNPHPPGPAGLSVAELDAYALAAMSAAGHPQVGSADWDRLQERFFMEMTAVADSGSAWALVGAFCVGVNFSAHIPPTDATLISLMDRSLDVLRRDGVAYPAVPPFALDRWREMHGSDEFVPAGWPSALEDVPLPALGTISSGLALAPGESIRVAEANLAIGRRAYCAARRADGRVVALIEGVDPSDNLMKSWEWPGVVADDIDDLLRLLGDRLITPPLWAHEALQPYFPCRARSRDEMRRLARAAAIVPRVS